MAKNIITVIGVILILLLTAACQAADPVVTPTTDASYYAVDPTFRDFYSSMGGKERLGEVISPVREVDGVKTQYTVNSLMIYDPKATNNWYRLGSIGLDLDLDETAPDQRVDAAFVALYEEMRGESFVGKPLTGLSYNAAMSRFEQYFENLGFYQGAETGGVARLLPYGAWRCGNDCRAALPLNNLPLIPAPTHAPAVTHTAAAPQTPTVPPAILPTLTQPPQAQELVLQIWETKPMIASDQEQEIGISLEIDGAPLVGVVADLMVTLPDGSRKSYEFPPTSADGKARLLIPAVEALNATVIQYRVCIGRPSGERYCIKESYTIWNSP